MAPHVNGEASRCDESSPKPCHSWEIRLLRILRVAVGKGIFVAPVFVSERRLQVRLDLPVVVVNRSLNVDMNLHVVVCRWGRDTEAWHAGGPVTTRAVMFSGRYLTMANLPTEEARRRRSACIDMNRHVMRVCSFSPQGIACVKR